MLTSKRKLLLAVMLTSIAVFGVAATGYADDGPTGPQGGRMANLAEQLGMTVEDLRAALEAGSSIKELAEQAGVTLESRGGQNGSARLTNLAEQLGMTVEDLRAALEAGSSIEELAEQAGVTLKARSHGGRLSTDQ